MKATQKKSPNDVKLKAIRQIGVTVKLKDMPDGEGVMHPTLLFAVPIDISIESNDFGEVNGRIGGLSKSRKGENYFGGSHFTIPGDPLGRIVKLEVVKPHKAQEARSRTEDNTVEIEI